MTEALIQNSEIKDLTSNIIQYPNVSKTESDTSFSTLLNNISTKAEETQSKFINEAAKKSNTSSINKYALTKENVQNNTKKTDTKPQTKSKEDLNNSSQINDSKTTVSKNSKTVKNQTPSQNKSLKNSDVQTKTNTKTNTKINTKTSNTPVETDKQGNNVDSNKIKETNNLNNDSLESSPVFLNENNANFDGNKSVSESSDIETNSVETLQEDIKNVIETLLTIFNIPAKTDNDSETISQDTSVDLQDGENTLNQVIKAIEDISSQVDDMDLSKENKEEILSLLEKLKTVSKEIKTSVETNNLIDNTKDFFNEIISNISLNSDKSENTIEANPENLNENISDNQTKPEIKNVVNTESKKEYFKTVDSSKEINTNIKHEEVKPSIHTKEDNIQTLPKQTDKSETPKTTETILNLNKETEETSNDNTVKNETVFPEDLNDESDNLTEPINLNKKDDLVVENKPDTKKDNTVNQNEKENNYIRQQEKTENSNYEQFKIKDDDKISEIVQKLKEFEKSEKYSTLDDGDKAKINDALSKLSKPEINQEQTKEDIKAAVENTKQETQELVDFDIKQTVYNDKKADTKEEIKTDNKTEIKTQTQTTLVHQDNLNNNDDGLDFSKEEKNNNDELFKTQNQKISFKEDNDKEDFYTKKVSNDEKTQEVSNDEKTQEVSNDEHIEADKKEINESKVSNSFIKEIREDFLENIEYVDETPSALSVSDEVVKLALGENNTLSSQTPVGNVTYDSANSAITIKNVQNLAQAQPKEVPQQNILNQIGDKLYQLKDSQKLTLVLRPNDLGRLSIELTTDKNGLTTNIIAQNEDVRNYIEKNINSLRNQLSQAGVSVNSIQIKTAGQENSTTYDGNQNREFKQEQNQQQNQQEQQKQRNKEQQKDDFANMQDYDMHFVREFSTVMNKTLSYMN